MSGAQAQREHDLYYLRQARELGTMSRCSSRQAGTIIVKDYMILSDGVNGAPEGMSICQGGEHGLCHRQAMGFKSGEGLEFCPALHGENAAIVLAARYGVEIDGATMYVGTCQPCKNCMVAIIEAGIKRLVHMDLGAYDDLSTMMLKETGLEVTTYTVDEVMV
ncbi:MAG: deoxycytidylate deaminase [Armatimonadota bacterium]